LKETGHTNAQIAARLRLSQGSVATLLNRAKRKGYEVVIVIDGDPLALFGDDEGGEDEGGSGEDEGDGQDGGESGNGGGAGRGRSGVGGDAGPEEFP